MTVVDVMRMVFSTQYDVPVIIVYACLTNIMMCVQLCCCSYIPNDLMPMKFTSE